MLLCSLYPISLPSHFVQFSACDLCFDGYTNLVSLPSGVCNLVGEVGPEVCALIPLIWALIGLRWPELALDIEGIFPIALWFSLPSLWWYLLCSLVGGIEPQICFWAVSDLWWEAGGIGAHPLGEKPLNISPRKIFSMGCALCVTFHALASSCVILLLALLLAPP